MRSLALVLFCFVLFYKRAHSVPLRANEEEGCIVSDFANVSAAIESCNHIVVDSLQVPAGETLRLPLRDNTTLTFRGVTLFGYAEWEGPLVVINGTNVTIDAESGSALNGQGELYWDGQGEWGTVKPTFFTIQLHNSVMRNIYVKNSPKHCVLLADSTNVELSGWTINNLAGDEEAVGPDACGHNTDGFDIWNVTNLVLRDTWVLNQDDCVAIRCGENIIVDEMTCYGGHGLSISVGFSNDSLIQNTLRNVLISNSAVIRGENGIHIKTHVDGGEGLIENVTYRNILIQGQSKYGINIQENYRNMPANATMPSDPANNIPIRNLTLENISGNVKESAVPIYILCAEEGCSNWNFENVAIDGTGENSCNFTPEGFNC